MIPPKCQVCFGGGLPMVEENLQPSAIRQPAQAKVQFFPAHISLGDIRRIACSTAAVFNQACFGGLQGRRQIHQFDAPIVLRVVSPETAAMFADKPFQPIDKGFVDRFLKITEADIVREAELKAGGTALILVELKSTPDPRTLRQIAGYGLGLCDLHHARSKKARGRGKGAELPPAIVMLVIYHGEGRFALPASLARPVVPGEEAPLSCRPLLCNLRQYPLKAFREHPLLWAAVSLLLRAKEEVGREELAEILGALKADDELLDAGEAYIIACWHTPRAALEAAMVDAQLRGGTHMRMGSLAREFIADGKAEGKTEGRAEIFTRLLRRRFGRTPPQPIQARLAGASSEELDLWIDRVFEASSLEAVFAE